MRKTGEGDLWQRLDLGPGSSLTLGGSGFYSTINIGQDFAFDTGDATLTIGSADVVSANPARHLWSVDPSWLRHTGGLPCHTVVPRVRGANQLVMAAARPHSTVR